MPNEINTNAVKRKRREVHDLDPVDRKILSSMADDAALSYADLGAKVHLSAPAVHERVKRLKEQGVIVGTEARLDGAKIGRPLLAFINVTTTGWGAKGAFRDMANERDIEEVHTITGDACVMLKVRCESPEALEGLLARLYAMEDVSATRSYVCLSTYLERGPQAELTPPFDPFAEIPNAEVSPAAVNGEKQK